MILSDRVLKFFFMKILLLFFSLWKTSFSFCSFFLFIVMWKWIDYLGKLSLSYLKVSFLKRRNYFEGALSSLWQLFKTESPLKMMKNVLCFTLKSLFLLKIFKFLFWLFGHVEKQLGWKRWLISKRRSSQPG